MHLTQNGEEICLLLREKRQCFCVNKNSLEKDLAQKKHYFIQKLQPFIQKESGCHQKNR